MTESRRSTPAPGAGVDFFHISGTIHAHRDRVFSAWTDPECLRQWFAPAAVEMFGSTMEIRAGGAMHFGLRSSNGDEVWSRWNFRSVTAPIRIVLVHHYSDACGGVVRHPNCPDWPLQMTCHITFSAKGAWTVLDMWWTPVDANPAELQAFRQAIPATRQVWRNAYNRLRIFLTLPPPVAFRT